MFGNMIMIKVITIISILIGFLIIFWRVYSELNIYTPEYEVISQNNYIEIRRYNKLNVITTTEHLPYKEATYSGFRTLANYIFGNNKDNIKIPMTAPVITSFPNKENIDITFIMNENYSIDNLPKPKTETITLQELYLGKVAVIKFGLWATPKRIQTKKTRLETYLNNNSIQHSTEFLVAQYNSPWIMPPFRKNEILVSIN